MFTTTSSLDFFVLIACAAATTWAPPNYPPSASADLFINYGGSFPEDGQQIRYSAQFAAPPNVSVNTTLPSDQKYLLVMIDASIPLDLVPGGPAMPNDVVPGIEPNRTTFVQWLQTNLTQTPSQNFSSTSQALAPYRPPNPQPTTDTTPHTYVTYLFSQPDNFTLPLWDANSTDLTSLSAPGRFNFSVTAIAAEVGAPVAAHYNLVDSQDPMISTTPTPTGSATAATSSTAAAAPRGGLDKLSAAGLALVAAAMAL